MHINDIGYDHCHNADFQVQRPFGSGDYLFLLLKTSAVFTWEGEDIIAEPASFLLFKKGTPQLYRAYGPEFSNDWFHFDFSDDEQSFFEELSIPFDKIVQLDHPGELSLLIKNMCHENYSSNPHKADSTELYLKLFFIKLSEKMHSAKEPGADPYHDKLSILRSRIYSKPYHNWKVETLAASLTMSKSHFHHLYKKLFGTSVINDVITSRTEHAKHLLSTTDLPVTKIAEMCGYNSGPHFMKQFKTRMNMTPSEYRGLTKR